MYCGILSCTSPSPLLGRLPKFVEMTEGSPSEAAMDTRSDEAAETEIDIEDDISVGSASPPPAVRTDTDDSMAMAEDIDIENERTPKEHPDKRRSDREEEEEDESRSSQLEKESPSASPEQNKEGSESLNPSAAPRTPPIAHQGNNGVLQRALKFSIDNILKPDFGRRNSDSSGPVSDQPVDLSRVQNLSPKNPITVGSPQETQSQPPQEKDKSNNSNSTLWPAWVYCTRYSDRPSAGPRTRRIKKRDKKDEKRPRTAFTSDQLARLKKEFQENRYLTEKRRQDLARDLGLNESQIKIWFQNKRAKIKKQVSGQKNPLALQLMAQGLYNHSTIPVREEDEEKMYSVV